MIDIKNNRITDFVIVRLSTSWWNNNRGLFMKRSLTYLKRKSSGYNIFDEDSVEIGASEVFPRITNLNDCEDGVYKVNICNVSIDYETGAVDDYDYILVPWTNPPTEQPNE